MGIRADLAELLALGILDRETAEKIEAFYKNRQQRSPSRLLVAFAVLGATLVGLGIILILAHNWDQFSRSFKTLLSFLPLLMGQGLCGYALLKKQGQVAWREGSATFLFFSVGASIALVSQVYHLPGGTGPFLLTWMLLCLPLFYLMRSSMASLLYLGGITYFVAHQGYGMFADVSPSPYLYWLLLLMAFPYYFRLYKHMPNSNFSTFHSWAIPLSLTLALGTVIKTYEELLFVAYFGLFAIFYLTGKQADTSGQKGWKVSFAAIGSFGTVVLLLVLSFSWFWEDLQRNPPLFEGVGTAPDLWVAALLIVAASVLLLRQGAVAALLRGNPLHYTFLLFLPIFILGAQVAWAAVVMVNMLLLGIGVYTILKGTKQQDLGTLNYGLLMVTALVVCRFFDTNMSYVVRGILFLVVGVGFFAANYFMITKQRRNG